MSEQEIVYCLIAFILGWMISKHMGDGFSIGGQPDLSCAACGAYITATVASAPEEAFLGPIGLAAFSLEVGASAFNCASCGVNAGSVARCLVSNPEYDLCDCDATFCAG